MARWIDAVAEKLLDRRQRREQRAMVRFHAGHPPRECRYVWDKRWLDLQHEQERKGRKERKS